MRVVAKRRESVAWLSITTLKTYGHPHVMWCPWSLCMWHSSIHVYLLTCFLSILYVILCVRVCGWLLTGGVLNANFNIWKCNRFWKTSCTFDCFYILTDPFLNPDIYGCKGSGAMCILHMLACLYGHIEFHMRNLNNDGNVNVKAILFLYLILQILYYIYRVLNAHICRWDCSGGMYI